MSTPQSNVSEREARAVAEAAREKDWVRPSFVRELFLGRLRLDLIDPLPKPDPEIEAETEAFLERLETFLREKVDPAQIEREDRVPQEVLDGLNELGAFGMKIPKEYGGLGLHAASSTTAPWRSSARRRLDLLGAALGAPVDRRAAAAQAVRHRRAEEEVPAAPARRARSRAFALTEPTSAPIRRTCRRTPSRRADGKHFILNGEKLWCTNGTRAELLVVMARTPDVVDGKQSKQITAFIVESDWPGVEIVHRCHFMGLKAIENGVIQLHERARPAREHPLGRRARGSSSR